MNKLFSAVCMAGAFAVMFSSCNKKEDVKSFAVALPQFEETVVDGERAYLDFNDGNKFKWNANDQIMVYNLDAENGENSVKAVYSTDASAEGQTLATFTGDDLGKKADHYFIFFPASKVSGDQLDHYNRETFNVPATQQYTLAGNSPVVDPEALTAACEVSSLTETFTLKHIFGICRVRLKGTKTVSSIVLHDNAMALSGSVSMKLHEVRMGKFTQLLDKYTLVDNELNPAFVQGWNDYRMDLGYNAVAGGNDLTLNCGDGVKLTSDFQPFYFVVRPGAFIKGFTITVNFTDGTSTILNNYANPLTGYRMRPGVITTFSPNVNL